ncbi:MAG: hypothetical protein H6993_11985 [Pseudomonadales bacterium]|nr:hypothetical protein [Pseudomonadales bacterium]MCP5184676.1 hypothetical protein [Pseudomonadales bacterium]
MNGVGTPIRPGIRLGARPERKAAARHSALDARVAAWLQGRRNLCQFDGFRARASAIRARANAPELRDANALAEQTTALRRTLRHQPLDEPLIIEAFALISRHIEDCFGLVPHDEQLFAGWCLLSGAMTEMRTGEGKTLTAALPAVTLALNAVPVHVITANDYLVARDAAFLKPLYRRFGLRVDHVQADMDDDRRRLAYAADVVYCANKQIIFDYLRDHLRVGPARHGLTDVCQDLLGNRQAQPLLRGLCYAIVDEADSALVDDARTPMIISRPVPASAAELTETRIALSIARTLRRERDFRVQRDQGQITLTTQGEELVQQLCRRLDGHWQIPRYRDELLRQALTAQHLLRRDRDYLVMGEKVELIDESSGRILVDRKLQHGLHRCLEMKEGLEVTDATEPVAALSFQRFFPRYLRLAGMSGTLREVADELRIVYGAPVVCVPPHRPSQRRDLAMRVAPDRRVQLAWLLDDVDTRHAAGQPVLIGTRSVAFSELVSQHLHAAGLEHALLNARQDAQEASIIAGAGEPGAITVATNMAGRGTDIPLAPAAVAAGGLHVVSLEINDSARVDRQLFGRAGRQGDPGSAQAILSLEDELVGKSLPASLIGWLRRQLADPNACTRCLARVTVRFAQRRCERRHAGMRRQAHEMSKQLDRRLAFTGDME